MKRVSFWEEISRVPEINCPFSVQFLSRNYRENRQRMQHIKTKRLHREHFAGRLNSMAKEDRDDLWNNLDVKSYMAFTSQKSNHKPTDNQSNRERTDVRCASKLCLHLRNRMPRGATFNTKSMVTTVVQGQSRQPYLLSNISRPSCGFVLWHAFVSTDLQMMLWC